MRTLSFRFFVGSFYILAASALAVCTDPTGAPAPRTSNAVLSLAPVFSTTGTNAAQAYSAIGIEIDRVRILISRPSTDTVLADTTVMLAGRKEIVLDVGVRVQPGVTVLATVELKANNLVLFAGSKSVVAHGLQESRISPAEITMLPVGPGAAAARVEVVPQSGTYLTTETAQFLARVFDRSNDSIPNALIDWSVDDPRVGSIDRTGLVSPTAAGGRLSVRAKTLNGVIGEATITFERPLPQLAIVTFPGGATSGIPMMVQPVVQVRDANGTPMPTSNVTVTAEIASGNGRLVGTTSRNAVNGTAAFTDLRINGSGPHSLVFKAAGFNATASVPFMVTQTPAALSIETQPGDAMSGAPLSPQPVIHILDHAGLLVSGSTLPITASRSYGTGVLVGTTTVKATNGIASFSDLRIDSSGEHSLTFSTSSPALDTTSARFTIHGTATEESHLAIGTQPAGAVSGLTMTTQPVIEIRDGANRRITTAPAEITAAIISGTGTLRGTKTVSTVNGVAQFADLRVDGAGSHILLFTAAGFEPVSASFVVTQMLSSLSVATQPDGAVTGSSLRVQPVIHLLDDAHLLIANSTVAVTAAVSAGDGTALGSTTADAINGVAAFTSLRVDGTGTQVLTFSASTPARQITSSPFVMGNPTGGVPPSQRLVIGVQPSGATSGKTLGTQPVVEVRDANSALVSGSGVSVSASIASGTGKLVGATSALAANGIATFSTLRIDGAGPHTLSFTASSLAPVSSSPFVVTQIPASLAIATQPRGALTGSPLSTQPVIQIVDDANLLITSATLPVTASITSGNGRIASGETVNAVGGIAGFSNLGVDGTGSQVITFSTSTPSVRVSSAPFTASGIPTQLVVVDQPKGAVSGVPLAVQPVIEVRDVNGINAPGAPVSVVASIELGLGTLTGQTVVNAVDGYARFSTLQINGPGAHTLSFRATALAPATSSPINVTQTPAALSVKREANGATSGSLLSTQPAIEIVDNAGIVIATSTIPVTVAISGTGTLYGTSTVGAVGGVATFTNLRIDGQGQQTLVFSTSNPALQIATTLVVGGRAPTRLVVTGQPAGAVSGFAFLTQPFVELRDATDSLAPGIRLAVTASIASGSGTLVGEPIATSVNGVASFSNLQINGAGPHTLRFTAAGLTAATSNPLDVTQASASLAIATQPGGAVSGSALTVPPIVRILDNGGVTNASATVQVTAVISSGNGTIVSGGTATAVAGVATFTNLRVDGMGPQVLTFSTSNPALRISSAPFTVSPPPPAISLSTASLTFSTIRGTATPGQTITITNGGGGGSGALSDLHIGETKYGTGAGGWLPVFQLSSGGVLTVRPSTISLAVGTYTATFEVVSAVASNSPRIVTVTLTVTPPSSDEQALDPL